MKRNIYRTGWKLLLASLLAMSLALAGCEGDDGDRGPQGPPGPSGANVINAATASPDSLAALTPVGTINSVTISSPPVVEFTVKDSVTGVGITGLEELRTDKGLSRLVRFDIAKLVPPATNSGDPTMWVNYIRSSSNNPTAETGGTLVDHGDGSYTYTFDTDITNVADIPFEPDLTHRVAGQIGDSSLALPSMNLVFDFRPDGGAVMTTRNIVIESNCNNCHNPLVVHGRRFRTDYCVTCHNPTLGDGTMVVLVHKIHTSQEITFSGRTFDFTDVTYPQDERNCTKCHGGTQDGDNYKNVPYIAACGACHSNPKFTKEGSNTSTPVNFATGENHPGGIQTDNSGCKGCHPAQSIVDAHVIFAQEDAKNFAYNIISITNTAQGQFPVVKFDVTNPNTGSFYLLTDPPFTQGNASSLGVLIGFPTTDITNEGFVGTTYGQPININVLTGNGGTVVQNTTDGVITVTSATAIPADATGSGMAAIQGHPAETNPRNGVLTRIPVINAVKAFAITDSAPKDRRNIVAIENCNRCHEALSLHGNNRSGTVDVCIICHNANATDKGRRPPLASDAEDGLAEREIDIKRLIHAIHAADERTTHFIVYGFSSQPGVFVPHDFNEVTFPGEVNQCTTCHIDETYALPVGSAASPDSDVLGSTIDTGDDPADPSDNTRISPTAAVCSSCHDGTLAMAHMIQNGAEFDAFGNLKLSDFDETCVLCHGPGMIADVKEEHGIR